MECFHDFCLACDRETRFDEPYCSQACRLADLEKSSPPSSPTSASTQRPTTSSSFGTGSGYVLAPRYHFPSSLGSYYRPAGEAIQPQSSQHSRSQEQSKRSLTSSSSRSSLSSNMSLGSGPVISEQAKLELQEYFDYFEASRASKRRTSAY